MIAAYEKNHPDELESDIGQKIVDRITGISKQRKMFEQKVENINDICVRTLLTQSLERTTIKRAKGRKSKYSASEKTVYLAENAKVEVNLLYLITISCRTLRKVMENPSKKCYTQGIQKRLKIILRI